MPSLRHSLLASGPNNPDKQVSVTAWNQEHTLTGTANYLLGFDASGFAVDVDPTTVSSGGTWGSITGTLSDQTDLQAALDGKQAAGSYLTANQTITLGGDLSGSGATSITATIANGAVTLAKMANMATGSLIYRKTAGSGAPEVNTLATLKTDLGLTGTNSGDQTITLTGDVTGSGTGSFAATLANTAVTAGSYGDSTHTLSITVDAKGRITSISTNAISGGGGGVSLVRPGGRLTLTSGTPVLAADATAQTSVYYTPYQTDLIPIYSGSAWSATTFTELTLSLDTTNHVSGSLYDVYVWSNSGTVSIGTGPAWSSSTARGTGAGTTELQLKNGIWTNKNLITLKNGAGAGTTGIPANTATYVGTIYATANGQTGMAFKPAAAAGGTNNILGVYNAHNRIRAAAVSRDSTSSWTYGTATWRAANNSNSNRVSYVDGLGQSAVAATVNCEVEPPNTSSGGSIGASLDSTSATPDIAASIALTAGAVSIFAPGRLAPSLGFHFVQAQEAANTSTNVTYFGVSTSPTRQTQALSVELEM